MALDKYYCEPDVRDGLENTANIRFPTEEAANMLGIKPQTLYVWISTKRYPVRSLKVGRLRKFRRSDLEEFLNNCQSEGL